MRDPSRILQVLNDRGRRGLGVNRIYKHLLNPELVLAAWAEIYDNSGALTPGVDAADTAEGMSMDRVDEIIALLKSGRYRPRPVRRVHIPKKNGTTRPLGLPGFRDKLVGQMIRMLLEAYYEPQFRPTSYGYRPARGVAHAVEDVCRWTGTIWWIEGDISDCFGSLDHDVMMAVLAEKIDDERLLRLIRRFLEAGYLEDWQWQPTEAGAPQGGVLSPLLSNIYLHQLDQFVEQELIPRFHRGRIKEVSPEYKKLSKRLVRARNRGDVAAVRRIDRQRRTIPSKVTHDPGYRRLRYVRYADDHLLGFIGPRAEAEAIKLELSRFLRERLKLQLNWEKTAITHAKSAAARFLGFEMTVRFSKDGSRPGVNGNVYPQIPGDTIRQKCRSYQRGGKAAARGGLLFHADWEIAGIYQKELSGLYQFYRPALNVAKLHRVAGVMKHSFLRTLAGKHRSTVKKMHAKYGEWIEIDGVKRRRYAVPYPRKDGTEGVASFGPFRLTWKRKVAEQIRPWRPDIRTREVVKRLRRGVCELCGTAGNLSVHQVRRLIDLQRESGSAAWATTMLKMRRLTLMTCQPCHNGIHGVAVASSR